LAELNIAYLESLSTGELTALAGKHDLDIPPELDRVFIIEELLYLNNETETGDNGGGRHQEVDKDEFMELVVLPKQYDVSFIDVLIRDPLWAFAFWEIKAHDRVEPDDDLDINVYCLRVIPLDENSLRPNMAASFIVTLDKDEHGRYLGFPPEDGPCFKVELCMQNGENFSTVAESRPFRLPPLIRPKRDVPPGDSAAPDACSRTPYGNPLARLSGVEHFSLIRSDDRLLRPRGAHPGDM
jgi:hypothetical protein